MSSQSAAGECAAATGRQGIRAYCTRTHLLSPHVAPHPGCGLARLPQRVRVCVRVCVCILGATHPREPQHQEAVHQGCGPHHQRAQAGPRQPQRHGRGSSSSRRGRRQRQRQRRGGRGRAVSAGAQRQQDGAGRPDQEERGGDCDERGDCGGEGGLVPWRLLMLVCEHEQWHTAQGFGACCLLLGSPGVSRVSKFWLQRHCQCSLAGSATTSTRQQQGTDCWDSRCTPLGMLCTATRPQHLVAQCHGGGVASKHCTPRSCLSNACCCDMPSPCCCAPNCLPADHEGRIWEGGWQCS